MAVNFTGADRVGAIGGYIGGIGQLLNGGILNGGANCNTAGGCCSENTPATRWDIEQAEKLSGKDMEIASLRSINISRDYTDAAVVNLADRTTARFERLEARVAGVETYAAVNTTRIGCMEQQIMALQGLTKVVIPQSNICASDYPVVVTNTECNPVITKASKG